MDSIKVYVPLWQKQASGSNDCGVFAIGNLVEFCLNGYRKTDEWVRERKWQFKMEGARKYLKQCLEDESFVSPAHYGFPKDYLSSTLPVQCQVFEIETNYSCGLSNFYDKMVRCRRCQIPVCHKIMWLP